MCLALCVWQRLVGWGWDGRVQAELHDYSCLLQLWCVSLGEMGGDVGYWKNRGSGCFTKMCVCVCCVCVGAEAGTGAGQTIGPRVLVLSPIASCLPAQRPGFWWMRCWINNSRTPLPLGCNSHSEAGAGECLCTCSPLAWWCDSLQSLRPELLFLSACVWPLC